MPGAAEVIGGTSSDPAPGGYGAPPPPGGYGGPPPPGWGGPADGGAPSSSGKALASMITGLVGLLSICCGLLIPAAIVGIVLGVIARRDIERSNGRLTGSGQALTGIIAGAIGVVLWIVWLILVVSGAIDLNFDMQGA